MNRTIILFEIFDSYDILSRNSSTDDLLFFLKYDSFWLQWLPYDEINPIIGVISYTFDSFEMIFR